MELLKGYECPSNETKDTAEMHNRGKTTATVRHSQQPVLYFEGGGGWSITSSVDEHSPPPHIAAKWPQLSSSELNSLRQSLESLKESAPEPMRCVSPTLPARSLANDKPTFRPEIFAPPPQPPLQPPSNGNGGKKGGGSNDEDDLNKKLAHALKTIELQQKVIQQLCALKMHISSANQ